MKRLASALANAGLLLLPFLLAEGVFRLLPVADPPAILPVNERAPVARFEPNVDYRFSRDWNFSVVTRKHTNNYGFAHAADFRAGAPGPLLALIGDSFVEANVVDAGRSVAEVLDAGLAGRGRVYGLGMSGAPLSQYLAYAQFARDTFRPAAMAFVIIGNDFDESLLKYKRDGKFHYFDEHGVLRRVDYEQSGAKRLLRRSAALRYVVHNLEALHRFGELAQRLRGVEPSLQQLQGEALALRVADARRAVDLFLDQLPARSGLGADAIVFVVDGVRPQIYTAAGRARAEESFHGILRRYFAAQASARGYGVIDMQPVFIRRHERDGARFEAAPTDSHWNALGHQAVAEELRRSPAFRRLFGLPVQPEAHGGEAPLHEKVTGS
jgi:hypothetical protein